jgi:hypothetical protein
MWAGRGKEGYRQVRLVPWFGTHLGAEIEVVLTEGTLELARSSIEL